MSLQGAQNGRGIVSAANRTVFIYLLESLTRSNNASRRQDQRPHHERLSIGPVLPCSLRANQGISPMKTNS